MIYPSIDKLLTKVGSKYLLVHIASRRAKNIGRALEEVMEDLIQID